MIPVGKYPAVALPETAVFSTTPTTGSDYLEVVFRVTGDGPQKGEEMKKSFWLTPAAKEYAIADLRACGCTFPGGDITDLAGLGTKEVEIVVQKQKPKEGEVESKYNEIRFINDPNAPRKAATPIAADKKEALRARLRADVLASEAAAAGKGGQAPATGKAPF